MRVAYLTCRIWNLPRVVRDIFLLPPCASECASLTRLFTERQTAGMGSVPAYEQSVLACPGVRPGTGAAKVSCDNGWRFARTCEALARHLWDLM